MKLQTVETPGVAHFGYVIAAGNHAAVIDPQRDIGPYMRYAHDMGVRITHIFETHRQEDFVMGSSALQEATGAKIVNGVHELFGRGDIRLDDEDSLQVGGMTVKAWHTPGHTPESMCYAVYENDADYAWCVFTGDTLFFGDTGRTDLTDADKTAEHAGQLFDSVHQKLSRLAETALVLPAHGPGSVCGSGMAERPLSTLGEEKRYNKVFCLDRSTFIKEKGSEVLPRPPYFRKMEEVNLEGGLSASPPLRSLPLLDLDEFCDSAASAIIIDTREPEAFASAHISNSYSIWLDGLPAFAGWVTPRDTPVLLVHDDHEDLLQAAGYLSTIGIDNVLGTLRGGFSAWRNAGKPMASAGIITPAFLADNLKTYQVLDVREDHEFEAGHIDGALHCFVGHLESSHSDLDLAKERPLAVTCGVGHRAGLGVSILKRAGYERVFNLLGGMSAWSQLELPKR